MLELSLFNFILFNFQEASLKSHLVMHCWDKFAMKTYAEMATRSFLYGQYLDLRSPGSLALEDFAFRHFKDAIPVLGVFLDVNCLESERILRESSSNRLFTDHFHWLIYDRSGDLRNITRNFSRANVSVNSDVTYAMDGGEDSSSTKFFTLYDVYNNGPHIGGKLNVTADRRIACNASQCIVDSYLSKLHERPRYGNRNRQSDISLRVATVITEHPLSIPFSEKINFLLSERDPYKDLYSKFGYNMVVILKDMMQCNLTPVFFNKYTNSDYIGGSIGSMAEESTDISSSPNAVTKGRLQFFTAIAETSSFRVGCIFRTPQNVGLQAAIQIFVKPFRPMVWTVFGVIIFLASIQLWMIFIIESRKINRSIEFQPSFLTSFLITFGTACTQGSYLLPRSFGGRFSFFVLILSSFIMYNYYTSLIVSTLLGAPAKSDIQTLAQLAESSLEVGFEADKINYAYLNSSLLPAVRSLVKNKIYSRKNPFSAFLSLEEGILRVRDRKGFVFSVIHATGFPIIEKYFTAEEICDLNEILLRPERMICTILHKNSTYKELVRLRTMRLLETGVSQRFGLRHIKNRLICFPGNHAVDVGLDYTAPLFVMLLGSFILAWMIFLLEMAWKNFGLSKWKAFLENWN